MFVCFVVDLTELSDLESQVLKTIEPLVPKSTVEKIVIP